MSLWGNKETAFFYELTPDVILNAIEATLPVRCTGRINALNSMENRVYDIEIDDGSAKGKNIIAKFYRPGRWNFDEISEEHQFLFDLRENEIPVVPPLTNDGGQSLFKLGSGDILFCIYEKFYGRSPDEVLMSDWQRLGRLLGRIHLVGKTKKFNHRRTLTTESYGISSLNILKNLDLIPQDIRQNYFDLIETICQKISPLLEDTPCQRIHGDAHLGNLLLRDNDYYWVDFDDTLMGPTIQDFWLFLPGRDGYAQEAMRHLIEGYQEMNHFNPKDLRLMEPLRALRLIHFNAWIALRWEDPAFKKAFSFFSDAQYWYHQSQDLKDQLGLIDHSPWEGLLGYS